MPLHRIVAVAKKMDSIGEAADRAVAGVDDGEPQIAAVEPEWQTARAARGLRHRQCRQPPDAHIDRARRHRRSAGRPPPLPRECRRRRQLRKIAAWPTGLPASMWLARIARAVSRPSSRVDADDQQAIVGAGLESGFGEPGGGEFEDRSAQRVAGIVGENRRRAGTPPMALADVSWTSVFVAKDKRQAAERHCGGGDGRNRGKLCRVKPAIAAGGERDERQRPSASKRYYGARRTHGCCSWRRALSFRLRGSE